MNPPNIGKNEMAQAREHLYLADDQMKRGNFNTALEYVRKVFETDPKNMYARAYEERILMTMAEAKARKDSERILSKSMRDFITSQEKPAVQLPSLEEHIHKTDPIVKEINDSIEAAREKLFDVIINKLAKPEDAVSQAKATVINLTGQLKLRLERIKGLMIDHEKDMLNSVEEIYRSKTRKLYRSMVYTMHKQGIPFEHRSSLLFLLSYYGGFSVEEEAELRHNAELGIYEDLLKNVHLHQHPTEQNIKMLELIRKDFDISNVEHELILAQTKSELLLTEIVPTMAVIDGSAAVRELIMNAVRSEFPKIHITAFESPEEFLKTTEQILPNIVLSGTLFASPGYPGIEMLKKLKEHPFVTSRTSELILMLPSNDPFFREAVEEMGFSKILQKPFSRELLLWTLRPFILQLPTSSQQSNEQ
ncbi:MAG: hypothetical protein KA247_00535 [Bacteroidetes bacterium]|nr:hypothetical protein [Bacteroidota bacterium]